jgi:Fe2+ or Zn2+ uptake regulation protein
MKQQRNTKQRQMVLGAVRARCDHPSADQIYLDVRSIDDRISRGTVYRNLNFLVRQGEVLQVKLPNTDRFEGQLDKHYHLLCTECGAVCDVPLPYHSDLDKQAAEKTGYTIERHRAVFEGLCPDCRQKKI